MSWPESVVHYLKTEYVARSRPFCFLIDTEFTMVDAWGDPTWCGLEGVRPGANMAEKAPYLPGSVSEVPGCLEFLSTSSGVTVHVHTVPSAEGTYVILLDAVRDHDTLQRKQQSVNELKLLHTQQQTMISRQKELISELVEAKAELDHHRREVERSSAAKSRFIAMMSHEFRTPLASIVSYSDMALEEGVSENEVRKGLEAIGRSSRHLNSLIEAVLDEARLDAGVLVLTERDTDIHELIEDLSAIMAPLAAEKGLAFAASADRNVPTRVRVDDVCLRQILVNLLGNAVKFTEEGSIQLNVSCGNGRLLAAVTDTGPGIDPADQERVFRAFERGDRRIETGAGLGLTISLRLAKLMNGEVSLDSPPGGGCNVELSVPVRLSPSEPSESSEVFPSPSHDNIATREASVLVCDDDEDMLALIEFYLHRAGYGLIAASSATEAVKKTIACQPDLVLMDVNVPGMSGVEAARAIRESGFGNPIVALTASRLAERESRQFTRCFRKPAPMQELLAEIKRLTHDDQA